MKYQESEKLELKSRVVEDIKKEIVAFANCDGGKLYIGIADDNSIIGVEHPDEVIQQISNIARDAIKPDITMFIHYNIVEEQGKQIVLADIQRVTNRPYYLAQKGLRPEGVYVRQGTSSVNATDSAILRMIKETDGDSFENMRSLEQKLTFVDAEKEFNKRGLEFQIPQKQTLRLYNTDGIFTNLAYLLSDQCAHTVKIAVFQGTDQNVFKDRREFSGSLLKQLEEIYHYIDLSNPTRATFEGLFRIDTRAYPEIAVREALLNCLVHRDYSISASTLISIYSDRMEFVSIGGLMPGIEMDDIMMGVSVCRNPYLANVFYRLKLIEAYGTGIKKIFKSYENVNVKPTVEKSNNAFKIVLPSLTAQHVPTYSKAGTQTEFVLKLAATNNGITRADVEKVLGISSSTAVRILRSMVKEGLLLQIGSARNTKYILP